ncbi:Uma2 family endonuclease [Candidatus Parabeggiatoa sp. HSG14]|uniref:Uma2 family endonuclease n=1 Tax=Candidatus Parabeggiatoa sp. HSG14 TaxID=3055593 RepID=UPI0025A6FD5E|nr:Uma2 family endonuclease [Thiotrichales bacterium HSG14]
MCIEAISESSAKEVIRDTVIKKAEYAQAGVKEYIILDDNDNHTAFYRLNASGVYVPIKPVNENIIQSTVLPGFQFRINDLYNRPLPKAMIDDPIYQGFVLPSYTADVTQIDSKQECKIEDTPLTPRTQGEVPK